MATRKVLQEIPILPPKTEEQSFLVVAEEAVSDIGNKMLSFPARAHAKYISTDEAKENIIPAELDGKNDLGKPADLIECPNLGDQERSGLGSDFSLQPKDDITLEKTAGSGSITPREDTDASDWRIGESNTPINFSNVTVDDFGISSESFTNSVGKSPKTLRKYRRRSTIGVRGSPEMNFLIRQIALQRSKKTTPEPLSNPFISPRNSILKDKISSFRNAFQAVEETEGKLKFPGFSEEGEGTKCNTLGSNDYGNLCKKAEPPVKRKKLCDTSLPEQQLISTEPLVSTEPLISTQPQRATRETEEVPLLEKISESSSSASRLFTAVSNFVNVQNKEIPPVPSSATRGQKRKVMFSDHLSSPESRRTLCHKPTCSFDTLASSSPVLRPVLKKTSRKGFSSSWDEIEDQRVCFAVPELPENENKTLFKKTVNDSVKKKKSVTFGKQLSPELFDKSLPANTPLRKGSTPYRQQESDTATPTAQEAVHQTPSQPFLQPDFDCQDEEDTFKPLSLSFDIDSPTQDSNISSPGNDAQLWPIDELENVTQENDHKEEDETLLLSYDFPANTTTDIPAMATDIANETFIACEPDTVPTNRVTRASKNNACISEDPSTCDDSQTTDNSKVQVSATTKPPSKRGRRPGSTKRVMVKVPKVKGKKSRVRPKKSSVPKPLYGERETVSKKPLLSPIPEQPECSPTPPISPDGSLNKGLVKRIGKRKGIRRGNRNVEKSKVHSEVGELFSDPMILKSEDLSEDSGCPGQEDLEVKHMESLADSRGSTEPADFVVQVGTISTNAECPLTSADKEMTRDEDCVPEPGESVPEVNSTIETVSATKPQKPKRRLSTRRRVSQTPAEVQHAANPEAAPDLSENLIAEHNTFKTITEGPKPEKDLLVEDSAPSPKLPVIEDVAKAKKGRRLSRNYHKPAIFNASSEPNAYTRDPCISLPQSYDNSTTFTSEPYLPFDGTLQSVGTEKKVRRSLRLRRDSGASGLSWVSEMTSSEVTSRRKSLSYKVQPLGNSNLVLENVTHSPNKEQPSVQPIQGAAKRRSLSSAMQSLENSKVILESATHSPNKEQLSVLQVAVAAKKTRRRTLCSSTIQQMTSLGDTKRRRSIVSYKDFYVPSTEFQTCHNNVMLDT
ncbi:cell division cycle-associated protein 2 isoform X2 [Rana temporaria]|uniref:cell division cycle-associated protein 2 isoform X2 n=1 Tax=Rana temporaria TaxID=8407 RepID=UPI001AACFBA8|nr:cell division cycle-associated protein 2 isoform X2 [Rana temporaria]